MQRPRFNSLVEKIPWRREWLPTPVFLGFPSGSAGKESTRNVGDLGSIPRLGKSLGKGKGYPLQYSGLENSTDCIVHGVAKSRTWLTLTSLSLSSLAVWHWVKNSQHVTSTFLLTDIEEAVDRGLADQELGVWASLSVPCSVQQHTWSWENLFSLESLPFPLNSWKPESSPYPEVGRSPSSPGIQWHQRFTSDSVHWLLLLKL